MEKTLRLTEKGHVFIGNKKIQDVVSMNILNIDYFKHMTVEIEQSHNGVPTVNTYEVSRIDVNFGAKE